MKNKVPPYTADFVVIAKDTPPFWGIELDSLEELGAALRYWHLHVGTEINVETERIAVPMIPMTIELLIGKLGQRTIREFPLCTFCTKYVYHLTGQCDSMIYCTKVCLRSNICCLTG